MKSDHAEVRTFAGRYDEQEVERRIERSRKCASTGDWNGVVEELAAVRRELDRAGVQSAYLSHFAAVAADYTGDLVVAASLIQKARELDAVNPDFKASALIILKRVAAALSSFDRPANDPQIVQLYEALCRADLVGKESHVALARHYLAIGNSFGATAIADALVALFPECPIARVLKDAIAVGAGDAQLVERLRAAAERPDNASSSPAAN